MERKGLKKALIAIIAVFAVFSTASFIFVKVNFDNMFARTEMSEYSSYLRYEDVKDRYDRELISFESGENKLQGYLYGAENTKGLVVISHGMGGGAEGYMAETLYFVDQGYQVFGYDNTGCYESEGEDCIGLPQSVIDLDAALSYIESKERFDGLPILLYGHSWGGYAVTAVFNYDHDIAASVSVAGFNDPMTMITEWAKNMMGGFAYVEYPYIYIYQKIIFGQDLSVSAVEGINNTDVPILIIHGSEDTTVNFDGAATIAYKDEILNPNVEYKVCSNDRQNDHIMLFVTLDAIDYYDEVNERYDELYDRYDGEIPEDIEADFYAGIDKQRMSQLDEAFMADVLDFYEEAIG